MSVEGGGRIVKVVDFGIAKASDGGDDDGYHTATNVPLGTYRFMSPEQARSARSVDARTDVWSLGVVLYQLLSDKTPFFGEGALGILYAIATQLPEPLRDVRPDVPEALVAVIERALSKELASRYQTVRELSDALAPFDEAPAALAAHPPGPPARPPTPAARPPTPAARPPTPAARPPSLPPFMGDTQPPPPGEPGQLALSPAAGPGWGWPPALARPGFPGDEVPNESVTSGSKSHVVPIRLSAPSPGLLMVPRWVVGGSIAALFGGSVVLGVGVARLRSSAAALTPATLSQAVPFDLAASAMLTPALPPTAAERAQVLLTAASAATPAAAAPATSSPRPSKARSSKVASEPSAGETVAAPPAPPAVKVLSDGEIFD